MLKHRTGDLILYNQFDLKTIIQKNIDSQIQWANIGIVVVEEDLPKVFCHSNSSYSLVEVSSFMSNPVLQSCCIRRLNLDTQSRAPSEAILLSLCSQKITTNISSVEVVSEILFKSRITKTKGQKFVSDFDGLEQYGKEIPMEPYYVHPDIREAVAKELVQKQALTMLDIYLNETPMQAPRKESKTSEAPLVTAVKQIPSMHKEAKKNVAKKAQTIYTDSLADKSAKLKQAREKHRLKQ